MKTVAEANPRSFPVQMALGTALRAAPRDSAPQQAVLWQGEALEVRGELGSLAEYVWGFVGGAPIQNGWRTIAEQLDPEDWALIMHGAFGFMNSFDSKSRPGDSHAKW